MPHLSVSETSKEDANRVYKTPDDPMVNNSERKMEFGATTFVAHCLLFGVSSVTELYKHEISTAPATIEGGVDNISNDIIVHGPDQKTHNQCLVKIMERLRQHGLTLHSEKCLFNVDRLVFMVILLSEKGIGPMEERVRAWQETREPETISEV